MTFAHTHKMRYAGTRWRLICGSYAGVEEFAVDELQRMAQKFQPYVLAVQATAQTPAPGPHEDHLLLVGTAANNPWIAALADKGAVTIPDRPEGYCIASLASPWSESCKIIVIAGRDSAGVLYGVQDLNARVFARHAPPHWRQPHLMRGLTEQLRPAMDDVPPFRFAEAPVMANRGLWTWGYVVYDYQRFVDNMARLRMNLLVLWNTVPPFNAARIIEYAHSRAVQVVFGMTWGWMREGLDMSNPAHRREIRREVADEYRQHYHPLGLDGIYFQTETEHRKTMLGQRSVASVVTDWVNDIAEGVYEIDPQLRLWFGLHAHSIQDHYADLQPLDPRITIMWEDAGLIPYNYDPTGQWMESEFSLMPERFHSYEQTLDYSRKIAALRPGTPFAMCAKGWTALDWKNEFEHHGPFILGRRDPEFIRQRVARQRPRWDFVNATWLQTYPLATRFYREMLACNPTGVSVVGLVEDGVFEAAIEPSVALFGQMLWDPARDDAEILAQSLSPYYRSGTMG
jgi:hypothetical protein